MNSYTCNCSVGYTGGYCENSKLENFFYIIRWNLLVFCHFLIYFSTFCFDVIERSRGSARLINRLFARRRKYDKLSSWIFNFRYPSHFKITIALICTGKQNSRGLSCSSGSGRGSSQQEWQAPAVVATASAAPAVAEAEAVVG